MGSGREGGGLTILCIPLSEPPQWKGIHEHLERDLTGREMDDL